MARPSLYTPEIVKEICDRLSTGEPLEQICRDPHMPNADTIHNWTKLLDGKSGKVASVPDSVKEDIMRARELGFDAIANQTRLVAKGEVGFSTGDVARDKLIIETDLKLLAKWHAKKYGDAMTLRGDKENPLEIGLAGLLDARVQSRMVEVMGSRVIEHEATVEPAIGLPAVPEAITGTGRPVVVIDED